MKNKSIIPAFLIVIFMVSCKTDIHEMSILTPTPHLTSTLQQKTITPSVIPATKTIESMNTQVTTITTSCKQTTYTQLSPNGKWEAIQCNDGLNPTLQIIDKSGVIWTLQFYEYISEAFQSDSFPYLGDLYPVNWSKDGEYLYFSTFINFEGGGVEGYCFFGFGVNGLFRLNLNTGMVSSILEPKSTWEGYLYSFSQNGSYLVYSGDQTNILDIATGQKLEIEGDDETRGYFTWSPDSTKLAFVSCVDSTISQDMKSEIRIIDLNTHDIDTLIEKKGVDLRINSTEGADYFVIYPHGLRVDFPTYNYYWNNELLVENTPSP